MKPESVQECWQAFHDEQDGHSKCGKEAKHRDQKHHPDFCGDLKAQTHHHGPQDLWQLWN